MSEVETPNPERETTNDAGNHTGDIIKRPSTCEDWRKVKCLGRFLFIVPFIIIFLIYVLWPTIAKDGADASQKGGSAPPQQLETATNTTGTSQTGNPDDSSSTKGTGQEETSKKSEKWSDKTNIFGWEISFLLRMIILVFLCGALGSYIHMATSFSSYLGRNTFDMDWFWWYWLRMPIGGVLALIFSLLIQGGVFVNPAGSSKSQPATLIGLAALIGMFSRQANEKLKEIFDIVFRSKESKSNENIQREIEDRDKAVTNNNHTTPATKTDNNSLGGQAASAPGNESRDKAPK